MTRGPTEVSATGSPALASFGSSASAAGAGAAATRTASNSTDLAVRKLRCTVTPGSDLRAPFVSPLCVGDPSEKIYVQKIPPAACLC